MNTPSDLEAARQAVLARIRAAETAAGRAQGSVKLVAVSKTFPAEDIHALYARGQRDFGENYIQEWAAKAEVLSGCPEIVWHVIGQVQSNKSRAVAEHAHWLHTLDRVKLAEPAHLPDLQVLLEINIANEAAKHGIRPEEMLPLARTVAALPRLNLRGLMCVAQADADAAQLAHQFGRMRALLAELRTVAPQADTLSMGMSADMETAVAAGATMVRVGSAIFGCRAKPQLSVR